MSIEETRQRRAAKQAQVKQPQEPQQATPTPQIDQEMIQQLVQDALQPLRDQLAQMQAAVDLLAAQAKQAQEPQQAMPPTNPEKDNPGDEEEADLEDQDEEEEPAPQQPIPESPVQRLRPGPQAIPLGGVPVGRVWIEPRQQQGRRLEVKG